MKLTSGLISRPQRVVIYGPEGIGKSTLAAAFPDPVFCDAEQGTAHLDVYRTPLVTSWSMYTGQIQEFIRDLHGRKTLVIDTADWVEKLAIEQVVSENQWVALGGNDDFGHSYNVLAKAWNQSLDMLSRVRDAGMNIVLLAHAKMRKFELPEEGGAFDRWELKLEKKTAAATREWADMVLFVNYKTFVVEQDRLKSKKARGGKRVMYTAHHPCWDAKNRHDLGDELEMEYSVIARCFSGTVVQSQDAVTQQPTVAQPVAPQTPTPVAPIPPAAPPTTGSPLHDLMRRDGISEHEVQLAVAKRGYYPADTPLANYDPDFVAGKLVAHWDFVRKTVDQIRKEAVV